MNSDSALRVFRAQTENVRTLDKARKVLKRSINFNLVEEDQPSLNVNTRLYALLYSAWAEAKLHKTVFTPHGLSLSEIEEVETKVKSNIEQGFLACLDLALPKVYGSTSSFIPNAKLRLGRLVNRHIVKPSELRNKFAHGQWAIAIKSDFGDTHTDLTTRIAQIDCVEIERWFKAHESISHLMEMLVCSPHKGFTENYWEYVQKIEEDLDKMSTWTIEQKRMNLTIKKRFQKKRTE